MTVQRPVQRPDTATPVTRPTVRGRFAPSPTGLMHLGNARTALLAWLQVRRAGGTLVLRMEDLDRARCRSELAAAVLADLRWLGLDWDEGPDSGGPCGPYRQREREDRYAAALGRLSAAGQAYRCYCSRADVLRAAGAPHADEEGPRYPGTCRGLSPAAARRREERGRRPCWRFRVPPGLMGFADRFHGPVSEDTAARHGDFVVWSRDGFAAYQLAVVVDDAAMGITEVLRGDDLLAATARQLWLYRALGLPAPRFTHVPLLLGPDGGRLAKRHGSVTISGLRQAGVRPEAVVGYLAFLSGLAPRGSNLHPRDLVDGFDLGRLPRTPARVEAADLAALTAGGCPR